MKPHTDEYRELRAGAALCRLHNVDPESDYHDSSLEVWDKEVLGYEALLQAKGAEICALSTERDQWRARALEDAWPFEWQVANELRGALIAKDAQIERLKIEWEGLLTQLIPDGAATVCIPSGALWSFGAAIKEATS